MTMFSTPRIPAHFMLSVFSMSVPAQDDPELSTHPVASSAFLYWTRRWSASSRLLTTSA
jgi:hypothetical protein